MKKKIFALILVVVMMLSGTVTAKAGTVYNSIYYPAYDFYLYIEAYCEDGFGGGVSSLYEEYVSVFVGATYYYKYEADQTESWLYDCADDEGYANVQIDVSGAYGISTDTEHSIYFNGPVGGFTESFSLSADN